eukprot:15342400-Alexandrium_andersonii.AAC.1
MASGSHDMPSAVLSTHRRPGEGSRSKRMRVARPLLPAFRSALRLAFFPARCCACLDFATCS